MSKDINRQEFPIFHNMFAFTYNIIRTLFQKIWTFKHDRVLKNIYTQNVFYF